MGATAGWDAAQYLKFERERTQPARDLASRIELGSAQRLVDLGCGPGTSTAVLRARWPSASCTGVDSSEAMLETARRSDPAVVWQVGDIRDWSSNQPVDLIFSNAALHWVPDHDRLLPRLMAQLRAGGALAVQMPANSDEPYQRAAEQLRHREPWARYLDAARSEFGVWSLDAYYDLLAPLSTRVELWETLYVHVLDGPRAVVEWTTGTGLRPWLARLPSDDDRRRFLEAYLGEIEAGYAARPDGRVLFPFRRRFFVAYRR